MDTKRFIDYFVQESQAGLFLGMPPGILISEDHETMRQIFDSILERLEPEEAQIVRARSGYFGKVQSYQSLGEEVIGRRGGHGRSKARWAELQGLKKFFMMLRDDRTANEFASEVVSHTLEVMCGEETATLAMEQIRYEEQTRCDKRVMRLEDRHSEERTSLACKFADYRRFADRGMVIRGQMHQRYIQDGHTNIPIEAIGEPIDEMSISVGAYNAMRRMSVRTVDQLLANVTQSALLKQKGCGEKSVKEVNEELKERYGVTLRR